jgi:hypothetical protein
MSGWLLVAIGVFAVSGAVFQWDFFMNHPKARFFVRLIGLRGTRIFYALLGTALAVMGVLIVLGITRK